MYEQLDDHDLSTVCTEVLNIVCAGVPNTVSAWSAATALLLLADLMRVSLSL